MQSKSLNQWLLNVNYIVVIKNYQGVACLIGRKRFSGEDVFFFQNPRQHVIGIYQEVGWSYSGDHTVTMK